MPIGNFGILRNIFANSPNNYKGGASQRKLHK